MPAAMTTVCAVRYGRCLVHLTNTPRCFSYMSISHLVQEYHSQFGKLPRPDVVSLHLTKLPHFPNITMHEAPEAARAQAITSSVSEQPKFNVAIL